MSINRLSSGAEDCITVMYLPDEQEDAVRKCITNYTLPDSFSEMLSWAVYRIWNAVKSLFGASDWQCAKKLIKTRALEMCHDRGIVQLHPQNKVEEKIECKVKDLLDTVSESLLSTCFLLHERNEESGPELIEKLQTIGLDRSLADISQLVEGIRKA